jgi:hypothetical protein
VAEGVSQIYRYPRASSLGVNGLDLAVTPGRVLAGDDLAPSFFSGFVTRPAPFADGLRALAAVAATRYVAAVESSASGTGGYDPVVTSNGDRLRFEAFSLCGSVSARLDVLAPVLDGELLDRGTTNVDVNEPLRRLLANVAADETLHLTVGNDEVVVTTPSATAVERKVPLPARWLRGFAESGVVAARFDPRFEVSTTEFVRFLRSLPRGGAPRGWVVPAGRGLRLSARPSAGAVGLSDSGRLDAFALVLRHARTVRAYAGPAEVGDGAAAWEADLDGLRLTLLLSPAAARGWSGEGALVTSLGEVADDDVNAVLDALAFDARVDVADLAERTGLDRAAARAALDVVGASGRVGYDLAEAGWFHRELPFDPDAVAALNPRLRAARDLLADSAVTRDDDGTYSVRSRDRVYRCRSTPDGRWTCTCQWWIEHRGGRGPCKHVLAAARSSARDAERASTVAMDNDPAVGRRP